MTAHPRLEARAHALLLARRAFTQSLMGLPDEYVWRSPQEGSPSIGEIARKVWTREAYWLWPPEVPVADLSDQPNLAGLLYALVRHRAVTEELLFHSTDDDLDQAYVSEARLHDGSAPMTLGHVLDEVMRGDLADAAQTQLVRTAWQADWPGVRESWERAAEAVAGLSRG